MARVALVLSTLGNGNKSMYTLWGSLGKSHSIHSFSLPWVATAWTGFFA